MPDEFTINPEIQSIVNEMTKQAARLHIDDEFWADTKIFANPNNIVLRQMRNYYLMFEKDEGRKQLFLPVLEFCIFKYCTDREWREVMGWIFWWINLYVQDKQYQHELPLMFEAWNDPREWIKEDLKTCKPKELMIPEGSQMLPEQD
jgi:hypothetical protein